MIDLHTHTNCSDGDYSPFELVKMAHKKGLRALAITDHDTVDAYKTDVVKFTKSRGVLLVTGVELSSIDEISGQKIHVLGLNIDADDIEFNKICQELVTYRLDYLLRANAKLQNLGLAVRVDDIINSNKLITKNHISKDVVSNVANYKTLAGLFDDRIPGSKEFLVNYLIEGGPAYAGNNSFLSTRKAVDVIKQAGGKAFCAHPSLNVMRGFGFDQMQDLILRNQFDGVEAINIKYDQKKRIRFDMTDEFMKFASDSNLLTSGGSDFHGDDESVYGRFSDLGLSNEPYNVSSYELQKIIER